MGARRIRREQRAADMAESRHRNGILKTKERARRDVRMRAIVKKGKLPYTPPVLSWLSVQLNKPGRLITPDDVNHLLKEKAPVPGTVSAGARHNRKKSGADKVAAG